jgi:Na+/H+ antiporter NhaD/arsenite permease-like protein
MAIGHLPGFRLDRTGAAVLGASLMVACGILTLEDAYAAVDFNTILLLLGMMIVVAHLKLAGFFRLADGGIMRHMHRPLPLLVATVAVTAVLSAVLVNDTICLVMTPLVFEVVTALRRNPVPYLMAVAMASNVGSTATITGNPQNIMIGSFSHIPYGMFAAMLAPIAVLGCVVVVGVIVLFNRKEFRAGDRLEPKPRRAHYNRPLLIKSVLTALVMIVFFFLGQPPAKIALIAGGWLLLSRRVKPAKIYRDIDWPLLLLFSGLFIVVAGLQKRVLTPEILAYAARLHLERVSVLTGVSAILSNIVSNVPAVLVLKPFILQLKDSHTAWLTLAMASTLAGNFTVVGSVANIIVVQQARRKTVHIGFWDYFRIGAPVTLLTLLIGVLLLH